MSYVYQFIEVVQLMANAIKITKSGCNPQFDTLNGISPVCLNAIEYWNAAAGLLEGSEDGLP